MKKLFFILILVFGFNQIIAQNYDFTEDMEVHLVNDGTVTIIIDSKNKE